MINFVTLTKEKKDKLFNICFAKRIDSNHLNIFQIDSVINTSKSGEVKLFKAISELKNLTGNNGWNNNREQFSEQTQQPDNQNSRVRRKNLRRPGCLA